MVFEGRSIKLPILCVNGKLAADLPLKVVHILKFHQLKTTGKQKCPRHSIPYFTVNFSLTYKTVVSYVRSAPEPTCTDGKEFPISYGAATYAYHGAICLPLALVMFAGSCVGSYVGAHYSDRIGNVWIKRLFIGIILIMAMKLLMDA
jgi:hypothetical protein